MKTKFSLCFLASFFFGLVLWAQDRSSLVELEAQLAQTEDAASRIKLLEELMQLSFTYNLEEAKKYAKAAQEIARSAGSTVLLNQANLMLGIALAELTQYDSAQIYLDGVLQGGAASD